MRTSLLQRELCKEVYGMDELPDDLKDKIQSEARIEEADLRIDDKILVSLSNGV